MTTFNLVEVKTVFNNAIKVLLNTRGRRKSSTKSTRLYGKLGNLEIHKILKKYVEKFCFLDGGLR